MSEQGVIVLGGHVQGLNIVRIFGRNSIPCIVLDHNRKNLARHSRFCKSFYLYPKYDLLSFLLNLGKNQSFRNWLLFPTNDLQLNILSENKLLLSKYFVISCDEWDTVQKCYNKRITYKIATRLNIPIAKTWMPNDEKEILESEFSFPCIIKPAIMHPFYEKVKKKVFVCRDKDELLEHYRIATKIISPDEIIIQEVIPGKVNNQYSACFLFNNERPLISLIARRRRQHPIDFGNATTYAETVENKTIYESAIKILRFLKYRGICEVEFMYDYRDNTFKFLEINARTWKWHSITVAAGIPLLKSYYDLLTDKNVVEISSYKKSAFRHYITDLPVIINLLIRGLYTKPDKTTIQEAVWDNKDILPGIFELIYLPYNMLTR